MNASPINGTAYYYGQRVIADGKDIVTVVRAPKGSCDTGEKIWIQYFNGVVQWHAPHNIRPLPNGEL